MLLNGVCTTLIAYLACSAIVAVDSVTLDVSLEAEPIAISGGYVVPERGNVTFTCSSQAAFPVWRVDLKTLGSSAGFSTATALVTALQNVSSSDNRTDTFPNPSSFTVHNIPVESNGSLVECSDGKSANDKAIIILVEGSPKCPITQTRVTSKDSLVVSVQQPHKTWLPVCYSVEITFYNLSIVTAHNSTLTNDGSVTVTSLQPGTVYNIAVTPCNMVGCNKSCDIHSANTIPVGGVTVPGGGGGGGSGNPLPSSLTIGLSIVAVAVLVLAMAIVLVLILVLCFYRRRRDKQTKGGAEQRRIEDKSLNMTEYAVIGHSTISTKGHSLQGRSRHPAFTHAPCANPLECSTVQVAISNSRLQCKRTSTLPPVSPPPPPPPPCTPRDATVHINADNVLDAGYATVPHSQGSKRIKVCSTQQNTNQKPLNGADSTNNIHNGRREDIVAIDSAYDDILAMSATPRDHASSHLPAPRLEAGGNTEGYEVMHSAPLSLDVREERSSVDSNAAQAPSQLHRHDDISRAELQYEEHRGGWASSDVVLNANPAYQPLERAAAIKSQDRNN